MTVRVNGLRFNRIRQWLVGVTFNGGTGYLGQHLASELWDRWAVANRKIRIVESTGLGRGRRHYKVWLVEEALGRRMDVRCAPSLARRESSRIHYHRSLAALRKGKSGSAGVNERACGTTEAHVM